METNSVEHSSVERVNGTEGAGTKATFNKFDDTLKGSRLFPLTATGIKTFQINVGRLCNQACLHCHVSAGPTRTEVMKRETMELCLEKIRELGQPVVDITGGAPEMNPHYRWLVKEAKRFGCRVMTRTNLTILTEDGYEDLPEFFAKNEVEVVASLPYYLSDVTDRQRGKGVFDRSIEAITRLNSFGYGLDGSPLALDLVYNPCGAYLPPPQKNIEADFRGEMKKRYGASFTSLFTITNMPIGRFLDFLVKSGNLKRYMARLKAAYNPEAARNVMCRELISVGWEGTLYDCDFNQMLGLRCNHGAPDHISEFDAESLGSRRIVTGVHCYGCTAGGGSSCTGAVEKG